MKRLIALIVLMVLAASSACAGDMIYINNPSAKDRLHLRTEPSANAESLGKYYNGAPVERIGYFKQNGWIKVEVGLEAGSLTGYMDGRFITSLPVANAMPQYVATEPIKAYLKPDFASNQVTVAGGRLVSLMGVSDGWWHIMGHTGESEGAYTCFVPAGSPGLIAIENGTPVNVYISNPDPTDRLHLRTTPEKSAKSLGKYYNGTIATLKGFTLDGEWVKVELYGRTGYMMTDYVTIEGKTNRTRYGIPESRTVRQSRLYRNADLSGETKNVEKDALLEVLGLVDEKILHVRIGSTIGYIRWQDTSYVDPK